MDFMPDFLFPPKAKKTAQYTQDYNKFKKALHRNPADHALKAQFIKFCLMSHYTIDHAPASHLTEALALYEETVEGDFFDPQVYYLVGRYYQEKDKLKAQNVLLSGVRHFNRYVQDNPGMKADYAEAVYAIALNFLTLQFGQIHPDLDKFFKTIRKSYPVLNKRVELENELRKSSPNHEHIKQLTKELRELKEITDHHRSKTHKKHHEN